MGIEDRFVGSGWSFPPRFDRGSGGVVMRTGIDDIQESLAIILTTALGERIMNPRFGSALDDEVFEAMNTSRISYLEDAIAKAIIYHEPRIDADRVTLAPDPDTGALLIAVSFVVRGTNSRFNVVHPYYGTAG